MKTSKDYDTFSIEWTAAMDLFNRWFDGQSWDEQTEYLIKLLSKRFGISRTAAGLIMREFGDLYSFVGPEWEEQEVVLKILVAREWMKS